MNITNDLVTDYLNGYYRPASDFLGDLRKEGERDHVPVILKETESFLHMLLALIQPSKILEIGTAIGYSAIYFAHECEKAEIYTIEKNADMLERASNHIKESGFGGRIRLLSGDGEETEKKMKEEGISGFDFVFIDGSKSHYRSFLDGALPLCREGAVIVSDNILMKAMTVSNIYDKNGKHKTMIRRMREYVDHVILDRRLDTSLLSIGDGLAVTIYAGENV